MDSNALDTYPFHWIDMETIGMQTIGMDTCGFVAGDAGAARSGRSGCPRRFGPSWDRRRARRGQANDG